MSDTVDQEVDTDLLLAAFGLIDEDRVPDLAPESVLRGPRTASSTPPQQRPRQTVVRRAPAKQQWGGDLYRAELARHPLLTADDEHRLALAVEAGVLAQEKLRTTPYSATSEKDLLEVARVGSGAFNEFLVRNLRLVYFWAAKYQGRGLDLDDLVQEGTLGLIRATHKFDYATGYKFSTYATWWIRQSVTRALADQRRTVRLPVHVDEKILQVRRSWAAHPDGLSDAEVRRHVSEDLDLDPVEVHQLLLWDRRSWSLEELIEAELFDHTDDINVDDRIEHWEGRSTVRQALQALSERDRSIMSLRFGLDDGMGRTLDEVGREFGLTRERIRQIESKAKGALRHDPHLRALLT